jgi:hypothetical protein
LTPLSPISPASSTNVHDEGSIVGVSPPYVRTSSQSYGFGVRFLSFNQQSFTHSDPNLLRPSPFSSASFTTGSIDDTFTVSEGGSFWSEEL